MGPRLDALHHTVLCLHGKELQANSVHLSLLSNCSGASCENIFASFAFRQMVCAFCSKPDGLEFLGNEDNELLKFLLLLSWVLWRLSPPRNVLPL
ncbi:uncharacterized protein LOC143864141 isoform X5 [Tasmannia lanceolata]|uniref:uncharacterized protein LOC143864141 isoform X5 n=1 Tax=Tasmannia lanceolata TaxID=3420 RepID=UPI004063A4B5